MPLTEPENTRPASLPFPALGQLTSSAQIERALSSRGQRS